MKIYDEWLITLTLVFEEYIDEIDGGFVGGVYLSAAISIKATKK